MVVIQFEGLAVDMTTNDVANDEPFGPDYEHGHDDGMPVPHGLPHIENAVAFKLRRATHDVFRDLCDSLLAVDLRPPEFSALALIAEQPGRKQGEVAARLGIKRSNFVALMDRIESLGLAERRAVDDRRAHALYLTEEGERRVEEMATVWERFEHELSERVGGAEAYGRLITLLDALSSHAPALPV
jgi:DNA-binding MarR family transcriptional regulator